MNFVVLDTDVWSYLFKQDSRAEAYRAHIEGAVPCVSFQTVAELYQWAEKADWGQRRREQMEAWLRKFIVLEYDQKTGQLWGEIRAKRERGGRPLAAQDAWVAACALRHEYPLLTHNGADYVDLPGLVLVTAAE